jgi:hypothetical protein
VEAEPCGAALLLEQVEALLLILVVMDNTPQANQVLALAALAEQTQAVVAAEWVFQLLWVEQEVLE